MQRLENLKGFFNVIELKLDDCPAWFSIALPSPRTLVEWPDFPPAAMPERGRAANGRGLTRVLCLASCLGEAAELASCCAWGEETLIFASAAELGSRAVPAGDLVGLTPEQYAARDKWNSAFAGFDWRPRQCRADTVIAWMKIADAYSGEALLAPADAMLIGRREAGDEEAVAIGDSNGCAAGEDLDAAKTSAVLELIERDALARWWYGRRSRPLIPIQGVPEVPALISYLARRERTCRIFDITTDIAIPAFAAVSAEPGGSDVALGSAAGLHAGEAARSAVTEMLQMELALDMARKAGSASGNWGRWRRHVSMATAPLSLADGQAEIPGASAPPIPPPQRLRRCLDACAAAGISLYFADLTRARLGVPAMRALSRDLCHFKPRFARPRLLAQDSRDRGRTAEALLIPNPSLLLV